MWDTTTVYEAFYEERATRECAMGCGLAAEPGDIYCDGCRSGVERDREAGL